MRRKLTWAALIQMHEHERFEEAAEPDDARAAIPATSREGSGTGWLPGSSPVQGLHATAGGFRWITAGDDGYSLIGQSGETADGVPLVDRQHPHDLFMEVAVRYRRHLAGTQAAGIAKLGETARGDTVQPHLLGHRHVQHHLIGLLVDLFIPAKEDAKASGVEGRFGQQRVGVRPLVRQVAAPGQRGRPVGWGDARHAVDCVAGSRP
jgi:hypothetical protein